MKISPSSIFRRLPIAQKFTLTVVFLIVVIMISVNTLIITYQKNALREEMESSHLVVVRNFAKDIVEPLMFLDPLNLDSHLQVASQSPGCAYALVTDNTGKVVAHTDRKKLGTVIKDYVIDDSAPARLESVVEDSATAIKEIRVPVMVGYEQIGTVIAGFSKERMEGLIAESLKGLEHYILVVSAVMLMAGVAGAFLLARRLTTPMHNLREKMERVRSGDLNIDIKNTGPVCSDVLQCRQTDCPAFGKERCWSIPGTMCFGRSQNDMPDKIGLCRDCPVYRQASGDEVGELVETFNDMVIRLRKSIDDLEKSNREKSRLEKLSALGEMSMTVAHEIKNPLNAIRGAVAYLKDNFEGEVLSEFLSIIEEETKRLNGIVTEYLVFSRPTPLKLKTSDFNGAVSDVVNLIRQEATENNIEMVTSLCDAIPPFLFDPHQIKQALLNILVNSLDASRPGDTIRITTSSRDGRIDVIIQDTGQGISKEVMPEIFKPFYTTKTRGSGLGLACVERIVREHQGEISVWSEQGKGTNIVISLPVLKELPG